MLNYKPGKTGERFLQSRKYLKLICGPVGGGKSTVALIDMLNRAIGQTEFGGERRTKFIILRNTMQQLKTTIKPLIDTWFVELPTKLGGYPLGHWRLTDNTFEIKFRLGDKTIVHSEFMLMAADTPDDVRRLLSVECSAAWVEEAREVDETVFNGLQGRVARFPSRAAGGVAYPGVICSTNPPPLGGFWHGFMTNAPATAEIFMQPPAMLDDGSWNPDAENIEHLAPDYYDNLVQGKQPSWIDVYIKNMYGPGEYGNPVYRSTFKSSFHVAKEELKPISQSLNPLIVGMDNGLQAAAVIGQQDARGRVNVFDECFVPEDDTMGVETFLERLLVPKLRNVFPMFRPENVLFVLDPACFQRSQVDEQTIAQAVQRRGFKVIKASTNDPETRIGAVEGLLARQIDGGPGILLDPRCKHLINGFEWGYRFRKTASGSGSMVPEKNHFSHLADAAQYFCLHYNAVINGSGAYLQKSKARTLTKPSYAYV
jgi:hypothetical protein